MNETQIQCLHFGTHIAVLSDEEINALIVQYTQSARDHQDMKDKRKCLRFIRELHDVEQHSRMKGDRREATDVASDELRAALRSLDGIESFLHGAP